MKTYVQIGVFVVALLALVALFAYRYTNEAEPGPCSPGGAAVRCYNVTEKMCDKSWDMGEALCKDWVKKMSLPPGRLTAPIVQKCQSSFIDNIFKVSRKSTPECQQMFDDLEGWRRRNMPPIN